jgi:uncharacterized protein YjgD (DUF1641 family)
MDDVKRILKVMDRISQLDNIPVDVEAKYNFVERAQILKSKIEPRSKQDLLDIFSAEDDKDVAIAQPESFLEAATEEQSESVNQQGDDEELAKTAGQLLESVSDNTSKKFQESSFFALMRQLRDHEVRVEGDSFTEVSQPA